MTSSWVIVSETFKLMLYEASEYGKSGILRVDIGPFYSIVVLTSADTAKVGLGIINIFTFPPMLDMRISIRRSEILLNSLHRTQPGVLKRYNGTYLWPLVLTWNILIPAWLSNQILSIVCGEITFLFPIFNGCIGDFILHVIMNAKMSKNK